MYLNNTFFYQANVFQSASLSNHLSSFSLPCIALSTVHHIQSYSWNLISECEACDFCPLCIPSHTSPGHWTCTLISMHSKWPLDGNTMQIVKQYGRWLSPLFLVPIHPQPLESISPWLAGRISLLLLAWPSSSCRSIYLTLCSWICLVTLQHSPLVLWLCFETVSINRVRIVSALVVVMVAFLVATLSATLACCWLVGWLVVVAHLMINSPASQPNWLSTLHYLRNGIPERGLGYNSRV